MAAKTSAAVKNKWNRENYDRIELVVKKGDKEKIRAHAEDSKESVNSFINRAISETMDRDLEKKKPRQIAEQNLVDE